jgi:uncharacterized alpha-E superfamily protein
MLSRTAASLYWLGRYVERAEFTARLVEATLRLDALSSRPAGDSAWQSALAVLDAEDDFEATGQSATPENITQFLTLDSSHPASVVECLNRARDNAKAVRTALSREAWSSINRAWLLFHGRKSPGDTQATLALVEQAEIETRGFQGALSRMLRNPSSYFMRIGAAIERADNSARLLDVKYHMLLPEGEPVGGIVDRDQWQAILHTVSAVNAYRWLYSEGLKPANVIEMLILRRELPRSLAASMDVVVEYLGAIGRHTGFQGEADRMARKRAVRFGEETAPQIISAGMHEYLQDFIADNAALDGVIARQFRFV